MKSKKHLKLESFYEMWKIGIFDSVRHAHDPQENIHKQAADTIVSDMVLPPVFRPDAPVCSHPNLYPKTCTAKNMLLIHNIFI